MLRMVIICIRMLRIPFEWFEFGFECFESLSSGSNLDSNAFECFESLSSGSNLDSIASNRVDELVSG